VFPSSDHKGGWGGSAHVRTVVLRPAVTKADGGDGLWWPEPMVVAVFVHVGGPSSMSVSS
jgi:hypothetical protein